MSESNNPVTQQPGKPAFTRTARLGILAGMAAMAGLTSYGGSVARGGRRNGKHNGQTKGAFGKQR